MKIRLATRGSRLALAQSGMIADRLHALGAEVELVTVRTQGDVTTASLASFGGIGVFAAAVREAVLSGDCDLAVHSLKDVPTTPCPGLVLAAVPEREDPRDALCARDGLGLWALPRGARVGTGSPRRVAQLQAVRWDLEVVDIRGNVDTRLGRVGRDLDAVVLAAAGLNRLGLDGAITELFDPDVMLPAPAQGALALECREDDLALRALLAGLDHAPTRVAVEAERELMRLVEAGCAAPFGALGSVEGDTLTLRGRVVAGGSSSTMAKSGPIASAAGVAANLARNLAPLVGLRVLMAPSELAQAVAARGARVTTVALTRQEPVTDPALADRLTALADGRYDWLALTSARTVSALAEAGVNLADQLPPRTRVAVVGPATAAAARAAGLRVDLVPPVGGGGVELAAAFPEPSGRVLVPGAEVPAPGLDAALTAHGWIVDRLAVYRTSPVAAVDPAVAEAWPGDFDAFVVTAPSAARAAADLLGLPGPGVVALGSTSAQAAERAGFTVLATAASAEASAVVHALATIRKES